MNFPERDRLPAFGDDYVEQEIQSTGKLGLRRQPLTLPCLVSPHNNPLISDFNAGESSTLVRPTLPPSIPRVLLLGNQSPVPWKIHEKK
ncbi:hypothetical protein TV39_08740 [Arthrobacter sp. SPG23]|nr:hypothetical protein TV39_08740 [Arthrobacter sp. SPG23]